MSVDRLIFVRHGQSVHHVEGLTGGWTDTPLTPLGRRQARATGHYLNTLALAPDTRCFTSDLMRAAETAALVGDAVSLAPSPVTELREINHGDATGLTEDEAVAIALPPAPGWDPDWRAYHNAESYAEMAARLGIALDRIERSGVSTAIVVGHGLSGQELVRAWLGLPLLPFVAFRFGPASVTELCFNRWGERQIAQLNRLPVLDAAST